MASYEELMKKVTGYLELDIPHTESSDIEGQIRSMVADALKYVKEMNAPSLISGSIHNKGRDKEVVKDMLNDVAQSLNEFNRDASNVLNSLSRDSSGSTNPFGSRNGYSTQQKDDAKVEALRKKLLSLKKKCSKTVNDIKDINSGYQRARERERAEDLNFRKEDERQRLEERRDRIRASRS